MSNGGSAAYSVPRIQDAEDTGLSPDSEPEVQGPSPLSHRNDLVRAMRGHPVFADLNASQLRRTLAASRTEDVGPGVVLYRRGESARHFYLLLEGRVNLALFASSGDEKVIEILGPGKLFGEVGMFSAGRTYPVTAITTTKARLARLSNGDCLNVLRECPAACLRMLGHLADRLDRHVQQIEGSTLETATDRIVRMLLARLSQANDGPGTVWLDESRQDLASYLSMKPETLSRALRTLAETGAISVHGRQIRVPSRAGLRRQLEALL